MSARVVRPPNRTRGGWAPSPRTAATGIALGALTVSVWPMILGVRAPGPVLAIPMLAHVAGMLAGYGVLVLMGLMSRWPRLEAGVGSDRLTRWHARGGRIVLTLILVHAWAAVTGWAQARGQGTLVALWEVLHLPGLLSATLGTVLMVTVAAVSVQVARRRLSYETWHGIHLLVYVGVAFSFLHQLAGPDLAGHRLLQITWALLYTHSFALVLRYRFIAPLRAARRHRLRVSSVVAEAPGVVSIHLTGHHLDELSAQAGQFFRWRFLTPDTWYTAHPFSLSAPVTDDSLRLTVKDLGDGSRLLQSIDVGTWVVAEGPYGAMTAARTTHRHVLLIAGGVGITPMRALFESLPLAPGQDLLLLYRARTADELVFRDELDAISRRRGLRIAYLLGPDRSSLSSAGLLRLAPDLAQRDVFLCASPGLAAAVRSALAGAGLPPSQLHEERFAF